MTHKRDLKRRVRERQSLTGESYMTALRQVQAQRPGSAFAVVETIELTTVGAPLGFKCAISMYPRLADRVDVVKMLERFRDALVAIKDDPASELMSAVVLHGARRYAYFDHATIEEARRFMAHARAGLGGFSDDRRKLALPVASRDGVEMVLFVLRLAPHHAREQPYLQRDPLLLITTLDGAALDPVLGWLEQPR